MPKLGDERVFEGKKFDERVIIRQKMIKNYGTSIPNGDEEKPTKAPKEKEQTGQVSSHSTFEQRVKKRKIAHELLKDPKVSSAVKKDLEANLNEYLEDPNIIFSPDGKIHYITNSQERNRVVYVPCTGAEYEIKARDTFDGSFGSCVDRARKMASEPQFPVVILP